MVRVRAGGARELSGGVKMVVWRVLCDACDKVLLGQGVRAYGRTGVHAGRTTGDYGTTASAVNQSCCPEIVRRIAEQPCDPPTIPYDPPATLTPLPPLRPYGLRLAHSPDAPPWGGGGLSKQARHLEWLQKSCPFSVSGANHATRKLSNLHPSSILPSLHL